MFVPPGGHMRKLVLFLIAFIAVVTFIRAFDNTGDVSSVISETAMMSSEK
jgi:hypothetical protein